MGIHAFRNIVELDVPEEAWEATGPEDDPKSRLLTTLQINGWANHLEAIAVKTKRGIQVAAHSSFQSNLDGMYQAAETEGAFQSVKIGRRWYVLLMTPFC